MNRHLAKPTWLCSAQQYWESEVGSNWMRQLVQAGCRSRHKWKGTLGYHRSSCGKGSSHKPPKLMNQRPNLYSELSRSVVAKGWMKSRPTMHSCTRWTITRKRYLTTYASQKKPRIKALLLGRTWLRYVGTAYREWRCCRHLKWRVCQRCPCRHYHLPHSWRLCKLQL